MAAIKRLFEYAYVKLVIKFHTLHPLKEKKFNQMGLRSMTIS